MSEQKTHILVTGASRGIGQAILNSFDPATVVAVGQSTTGDDGLLLPAWRELIIEYPHRFLVGTDPVWKVTRTQTWDQTDDGWDYFAQLLAYHRHWIAALPAAAQRRLTLDNARQLFDIR